MYIYIYIQETHFLLFFGQEKNAYLNFIKALETNVILIYLFINFWFKIC